jgi:NAD+ diphosphatase
VSPTLPGLSLARAVVDRDSARRTDPGWLEAAWTDPATRVVRVRDANVAVTSPEPHLDLDGRPDVPADRRIFLGTHDGVAYFAAL